MATPKSKLAYGPMYEILDMALDSVRGIERRFDRKGEAFQFRVRIQKARDMHRELSYELYTQDDPLYGQTPYAALTIRYPRQVEGRWVVRIEKELLSEMDLVEIPPPNETP
jgi:hypothetical protein